MSWRRWNWDDAKDDVVEYLPDEMPTVTGLPKQKCKVCWWSLEVISRDEPVLIVVRRGSKALHIRAPGPHKKGLKRTRCGRWYFTEIGDESE